MSSKLEDLNPLVWYMGQALVRLSKTYLNLDVIIYHTLRTFAEQNEFYAQGRTGPGKVVTNAIGGQSFHNYGLAFDFAVCYPGMRTINWSGLADINANGRADYEEVGKLAEDLGFEWGGHFVNLVGDVGHLQFTFGLSIKLLLKAYIQGGMENVNRIICGACNSKIQ